MDTSTTYFQLNVGFIAQQGIGYSREFPIDVSRVHLKPDLTLSDLSGKIIISRTSEGLLTQVEVRATTDATCGRCLDDFTLSLETDFAELFTFASHAKPDTEFIYPEDGIIDFSPLVREYMLLEVPINPLCKPDCKGLCPECGNNRNEKPCDHQPEAIDPRLTILKSLLDEADDSEIQD